MKKLRNFGFSVLALVSIALTSCHDDILIPEGSSGLLSGVENALAGGVKVSASALPAAITTYLSTNYPGKAISKAEKNATKYEVTLSDNTKLEFTLSGVFSQVSGGGNTTTKTSDDVKVTLPKAIQDYLNKNYAGKAVSKAEKGLSKYEVTLADGTKLEFSLDGVFIEISKSSSTSTSNNSSTSTTKTSDDGSVALPQAIQDYLNKNYAGKSVSKAEKGVSKYEVTLADGTKLEFTLDGVFIEISKNSTTAASGSSSGSSNGTNKTSDDAKVDLPQPAKDYIAKNHSGATILKSEKSSNKYEVKLSDGYKLEFDLSGKLVKSKYEGK